jgi:hypothetical protein
VARRIAERGSGVAADSEMLIVHPVQAGSVPPIEKLAPAPPRVGNEMFEPVVDQNESGSVIENVMVLLFAKLVPLKSENSTSTTGSLRLRFAVKANV